MKQLTNDGHPIEDVPIEYLYSPYENNIWGTKRLISLKNIKQYIINRKFKLEPWDVAYRKNEVWHAEDHEQRIAFLAVNPSNKPIDLDVGVWQFNLNYIQDGYHRIAAAIYRNETHIPGVFSGNVEIIKSFMGGKFKEI